jgi:hypothetical protein
MTKKQIRKIFNKMDIQINDAAISLVQITLTMQIEKFARNAKEWDLKRVKPENIEQVYWRKVDWLNKIKS